MLVSQRADTELIKFFSRDNDINGLKKITQQRGLGPSPLEYIVLLYILGFIWEEVREVNNFC